MLERLATRCYRSRRLVVAAWIAVVVVLNVIGSVAAGATSDDFSLPDSESQRAFDLMAEQGFATRVGAQAQIVFHAQGGVDTPTARAAIDRMLAGVAADVPDVDVTGPFERGGERQVSADRTIAFAEVNLADRGAGQLAEAAAAIRELRETAAVDGLQVELGGAMFAGEESTGGAREGAGLLAAVVILLVAFGSVLATGLPIILGVFGAACGMAVIALAANVVDMPGFAGAAAAMIAIGVGIDYALLVVTRYREALAAGADPAAAVGAAQATAGRAVLFAGTTVVIAVLGLVLMGLGLITGVAVGIAATVLMTMLASLTLLPALLGFAGRSIDRFGLPHRRRHDDGRATPAHRWSRVVQRRPLPFALGALALLVALALPATGIRLGFGDAGTRNPDDTARQAYDLLSQGFGPGFNGPLAVAAELPGGRTGMAALETLSARLGATPGVAAASPPIPNRAGTAAVLQVILTTAPQDEATSDLVHRLRDDVVPATLAGTGVTASVGGVTAGTIDYADYTAARLPLFFGVVLALSFVLLTAVFRSIVVPLKAVVMNLLSIVATYGAVVAVFQWGWGVDLLGLNRAAPVDAWVPMMLFAVVFGLSMDYEVFLLSRIREEYDRSGDNATAVADGLARTARVITAAAAVMVCVFASFVLGSERELKLFGFGLAFAVLLDATVVRMVLVPATMELLGDRNWWLPGWLGRVLPRVTVEASAQPEPSPRAPVATGGPGRGATGR
jgi:RND superfamily putative drug exporter